MGQLYYFGTHLIMPQPAARYNYPTSVTVQISGWYTEPLGSDANFAIRIAAR